MRPTSIWPESVREPETVTHDCNVMLDFVADRRLVGIEVLDASARLDLKCLRPHIDKIDGPVFRWSRFVREAKGFLDREAPIARTERRGKAWVEEIGPERVRIRFDQSGEIRHVSREQLDGLGHNPLQDHQKARHPGRSLRDWASIPDGETPPHERALNSSRNIHPTIARSRHERQTDWRCRHRR